MNIIHRLSFSAAGHGPETEYLEQLQIPFSFTPLVTPDGVVSFDISENESNWEAVKDRLLSWQALDIVRTEFTDRELDESQYLVLRPQWTSGYPMPMANNEYLDGTYGSSGCDVCGAGRVQRAPFQMKSEPKWGRKQMMHLNWVPNEFFVTPRLFQDVFSKIGISAREVLHHAKRTPLKSVLQLEISAVAESPLRIGPSTNKCANCGVARFNFHSRDFFPPLVNDREKAEAFRTQETFGEGALSWNELIITQNVRRRLIASRVRDVSFYPLAEIGGR